MIVTLTNSERKRLCNILSTRFGIELKTVAQCQKLEIIYQKLNLSISGHTIARIIGILESRKTYLSTLDILVKGLGYFSYKEFSSQIAPTLNYYTTAKIEENSLNASTISSIELLMHTKKWDQLAAYCEHINLENPIGINEVMRFGNSFRTITNPLEIQKLIQIELTRNLLFHYFIDEDDPNGNYAKALEIFAKSEFSNPNDKLLCELYKQNQFLYQSKNTVEFPNIAFRENVHVHLLSRQLENYILKKPHLFKSKANSRHFFIQFEKHFYSLKLDCRSWLIARCLKAASQSGVLIRFLKSDLFNHLFTKQYAQIKGEIKSTAHLIIQFFSLCWSIYQKNKHLVKPEPIQYLHLNESKQRIAIESAQGFLYFQGSMKNQGDFLNDYSKIHQAWIHKAIVQLGLN